jgi:phenylacetate-CoA ligase
MAPESMGIEDHLHGLQGRYIAAPQWLRSLVGGSYALLPRPLRHGANYARFAAEAGCADGAIVTGLALRKLSATLGTAIGCVPAYAGYRDLLSTIGDPLRCLAQLPLTSKEDIKRAPHAYRSAAAGARRGLRTFTGGSTAQPLEFLLERHVTRARETAYIDAIHRDLLDRRDGDLTLSLHGRTVRSAAREGGRLWMYEPIKRQIIFSSDHLERRYMPEYVEVLRRRRPRQIHAYPSALLPLAQWLAEAPCAEFTDGVAGVFLTSENIYAPQVALFRATFPNARIVKHYGHSERVLMATSLDDAPEYRFAPLYGHLELVDPAGRPIDTPGVLGEIVGTAFDNRVMPFVRYRTGDLGIWGGAPRPGEAAVLRAIEGRLQEFVVCRDRRLVSVTTLGAAHFAELALADCIQYEQHAPGWLEVKVVAPRALLSGEIAGIERAVLEKTQGGCSARVRRVERIERTARGKHRMLIQHLELEGFFGAAAALADNQVARAQPVQ